MVSVEKLKNKQEQNSVWLDSNIQLAWLLLQNDSFSKTSRGTLTPACIKRDPIPIVLKSSISSSAGRGSWISFHASKFPRYDQLMETPARLFSLRPCPIIGLCESLDLFNSLWVDYIGEIWLTAHYNSLCDRGSWIIVNLTSSEKKRYVVVASDPRHGDIKMPMCKETASGVDECTLQGLALALMNG